MGLQQPQASAAGNGLFSIVLAAGRARRFGSPKQLAEYLGKSLVRHSMELACQLTRNRTMLVVGANWQDVIASGMSNDGFFALNEDFGSGISSSIACGVRSIQHVADAVLILLADQPLIRPDHLRQLSTAWQANSSAIVASEYAGIVGVPAIFPASYFSELQSLDADRGARSVIMENLPAVVRIRCDDAAIDIDTPEDLKKL